MVYIARFPIHVIEKKRISNNYKHYSEYHKAYGYLGLDEGNRLSMYFLLESTKKSLRIDVAKHYLFDALLFNLSFRPIPRVKRSVPTIWTNENIGALHIEKLFNEMTPVQIQEKFQECLVDMHKIVKTSDDEKTIALAKSQFYKLASIQWKAEIISELWQAEKIKSRKIKPLKTLG